MGEGSGGSLPIGHNHSPVIKRLLHGIITLSFNIMLTPPQDGEFLLHVAIDEGEEREGREQDLGDE